MTTIERQALREIRGGGLDGLRLRAAKRVVRERLLRQLDIVPHDKMAAVYRALDLGAKSVAVNAGTRSGKTFGSHILLLVEAAFGPDGKQPVRTVPIIAPYKELTDKCFRMVWKAVVVDACYSCLTNNCVPTDKSKRERYIEMPWGARIIGLTAENPDSLLAEGWPFVFCDEFARWKAGVYEDYVERALTDVDGTVVFNTTPYGMNHWRNRYMEIERLAQTDHHYFATTFTSYDNPHISHEALDRYAEYARRTGSYDLFRMNHLAEFGALAGAVYPQFVEFKDGRPWHVAETVPLTNQPFILGIDWGFKNPFVCLVAQSRGDAIHIYDEAYVSGLVDDEQAALVEGMVSPRDVGQVYPDPSEPDAIETFARRGFLMYDSSDNGALNDVLHGIRVVRGLMSREDRPGLVIHPKCENLIREIRKYKFNDRTLDEKPVKGDDHAVDALRYLVVGELDYEEPWAVAV